MVAGRHESVTHATKSLRIVVHHQDLCMPDLLPSRIGKAACVAGCGTGSGLFDDGNRERKACAQAGPATLGPNAASVGFYQTLADGESQAVTPPLLAA